MAGDIGCAANLKTWNPSEEHDASGESLDSVRTGRLAVRSVRVFCEV